jgi:spermidine synthase
MPDDTHVKPFVYETETKKKLYFSICEIQSSMSLRQPDSLELKYTRTMMGFVLFHPQPSSIGIIGLGGGSLPKFCHRHLPDAHISVVEINPHVIALRKEFQVPADSGRFNIIQGDGADFVRCSPHRFDVLLVDGFDCSGQPAQLASQDFYDGCYGMLTPGGVLVVNLLVDHPHYAQKVERIWRSFSGEILAVEDNDERGNSVVFACKGRPLAAGRRPAGQSGRPWNSLSGAFARILSALKEQNAMMATRGASGRYPPRASRAHGAHGAVTGNRLVSALLTSGPDTPNNDRDS